jgi:hypothetical protein
MSQSYAVLFFAWGDLYVRETEQCILKSKPIQQYDRILLTDQETDVSSIENSFTNVIRVPFESTGLIRKAELIDYLPQNYDSYLLLDSDTVVLEDIGLGFEKATEHGIAAAQCFPYTLEAFFNFANVMKKEGVPEKGQLQYNTGVIFFKNSPEVRAVMELWKSLALKHQKLTKNDQPYFSLAMEMLNFNPYTLPITYNYRGSGEHISGSVKIWHSHHSMPATINKNRKAWPPRRAYPLALLNYDFNKYLSWPIRFAKRLFGR